MLLNSSRRVKDQRSTINIYLLDLLEFKENHQGTVFLRYECVEILNCGKKIITVISDFTYWDSEIGKGKKFCLTSQEALNFLSNKVFRELLAIQEC